MRLLLLCAFAGLALAGCASPYESAGDVDCDTSTNLSEIDDGATSPLRCERTGEGNASSAPESSSPR